MNSNRTSPAELGPLEAPAFSSWFVDGEGNLALLDEEMAEALQDETARAILRAVRRLPDRDRKIVLGIVRQFAEQ